MKEKKGCPFLSRITCISKQKNNIKMGGNAIKKPYVPMLHL